MDLISIVFTIQNIVCSSDLIYIENVLFLQNNFWGKNRTLVMTDKGCLESVSVKSKNFDDPFSGDRCLLSNSQYGPNENMYFSVIGPLTTKDILEKQNKKQTVLRFHYTYTNSSFNFEDSFYINKREKHHYDNFKVLIKGTEDSIKIENNEIYAHQLHIKLILSKLIRSNYIFFEDFAFDLKTSEQIQKFTLLYFDSLISCLDSFETFAIFLNFLKFEEDDTSSIYNNDNWLRVSYIKHYLRAKFEKDFNKKKNKKLKKLLLHELIEGLFKDCVDELKKKLLSNTIILPIKDTFTVDFYLDKFYGFIKESIELMLKDFNPNQKEFIKNYYGYKANFINQVTKMCNEIVDDAWEYLNVKKYFSELFNKEIENLEDYIEIDKIMCDYLNVVRCVKDKKDFISEPKLIFVNPVLSDNFECRLIKALEITLVYPIEYGKLRAFDFKGKELLMERNIDFFVRFCKNDKIAITFEKIREKNINEVEILSTDGKFKKKFEVSKYLRNYKKEESWSKRLLESFNTWILSTWLFKKYL